jgi:hypothetical protein
MNPLETALLGLVNALLMRLSELEQAIVTKDAELAALRQPAES